MSNLRNIKFLRNGKLYDSRVAASNALNDLLSKEGFNLEDGIAVLARYRENNESPVMTLVGYYYNDGEGVTSVTIFDVEGAGADVDRLILEINNKLGTGITSANTATDQLIALSGNAESTSAETSVAGAKAYANDLIATLDVAEIKVGDGEIFVGISEADGKVTASTGNLTDVQLVGYEIAEEEAKISSADTVGSAFGKIQAQINAMDLTEVSGEGEVITAVSEADGKVSASKTAVKNLTLGGYAKTNDTGDIASGDTVNVALSKLENKAAAITIGNEDGSINVSATTTGTDINVNIKSGEKVLAKDGDAGLYTDITISALTPSSVNVNEEYALIATDGSQLGSSIKIYKDSALVNFYLGHVDDTLEDEDPETQESSASTVVTGSGDTALCYVMQLANGNYKLTAVNVESFLQESEFASGVTADGETHIVHGVVDPTSETDSQDEPVAFLTVDAGGFKLSGIKDEINRKIAALDVTGDTAVDGKYISAIEETDGIVAVKSRANVSEAVLNNYEKGSGEGADAAVTSADTINQAISKLENQVDTEESVRQAIEGQSGDTYSANTASTYISGATDLNDADVKLDAQVKINADDILKNKIYAGSGISVVRSDSTESGTTIGAVADSQDQVIEVGQAGIRIKDEAIWECGYYDAEEPVQEEPSEP